MGYWERVISRLSVPGLILLALGILLAVQAIRISRLLFREKGERAVFPIKMTGLALVVAAALILLDWIPGL